MSEEQLKAFLEKVKSDTSLQEKLQSAADSETVLAIAKDAGFLISTEELQKAQTMISDEELEGAVGGGRGSGLGLYCWMWGGVWGKGSAVIDGCN